MVWPYISRMIAWLVLLKLVLISSNSPNGTSYYHPGCISCIGWLHYKRKYPLMGVEKFQNVFAIDFWINLGANYNVIMFNMDFLILDMFSWCLSSLGVCVACRWLFLCKKFMGSWFFVIESIYKIWWVPKVLFLALNRLQCASAN